MNDFNYFKFIKDINDIKSGVASLKHFKIWNCLNSHKSILSSFNALLNYHNSSKMQKMY
jgi:hypothetical protein